MAGPRLILIAVAALLATACTGREAESPAPSRGKRASLVDLDSIFPLKRAFNDDRGHTRLVLFLSPT
jgi:hypothetical protein